MFRELWEGKGQRVHFVGIGGTGMKALAEVFLDAGWDVSGSDSRVNQVSVERLTKRGVQVSEGHQRDHLPQDAKMLIYSPAVDETNAERVAGRQLRIQERSYPECVGELTRERPSVCVAGTHGKSTTTAMVGWIMRRAGWEPTVLCGGELVEVRANGWWGAGEWLVAESCEFRRHFVTHRPEIAAILSIEGDHLDVFGDVEGVKGAFREFLKGVKQEAGIVVNGDDSNCVDVARETSREFETFHRTRGAGWWGEMMGCDATGLRFRLWQGERSFDQVRLPVIGEHNLWNAVAAAAVCLRAGMEMGDAVRGLESFRGVSRRLENLGEWKGRQVISDYAHHPTALRVAIEGVKRAYQGKRVVAVFQPHQVGRVKRMLGEFADAGTLADRLIVLPVYTAREANEEAEAWSRRLVQECVSRGGDAGYCESLDRVEATLEDESRVGDVVMLIGAGDIERVCHELVGEVS